MPRPKTTKEFYAVTRGLEGISGIYKEWNDCSKVVLNVKAAIYQGCTSYEQAKAIIENTGGSLQIYIDGRFISCGEYENSLNTNNHTTDLPPETNEIQNESDNNSSQLESESEDNDNEITLNKTVVHVNTDDTGNNNEINDETDLKQPFTENKVAISACNKGNDNNKTPDKCGKQESELNLQNPTCFCKSEMSDSMLQCDSCARWLHYSCTSLPKYELAKYIKTKSRRYLCQECSNQDSKLCTIIEKLDYSVNLERHRKSNNIPDSNFMESLESKLLNVMDERLNLFSTDILKPMQQSFVSAIDNQNKSYTELSEIVGEIRTQQQSVKNKNLVQENDHIKKTDTDVESNPKYKELVSCNTALQNEVRILQKTVQSERHENCLKQAELEFSLQNEKSKTQLNLTSYNDHLKTLQQEIQVKKQVIDSTNTSLDDMSHQCTKFQKDLEAAQNEILSLKEHIGSLSSTSKDIWSLVPERSNEKSKEKQDNTGEKSLPTVTLIGTSNVEHIDPAKSQNRW